MPIFVDKTQLNNLIAIQKRCRLCDEDTDLNKDKVVCDVCNKWICLDCSDVTKEIFNFAVTCNAKINFVCGECETELPKIRDLLDIKQNQNQMAASITALETKVQNNATTITEQQRENKDIKTRLSSIEEIIKKKELNNSEFPPLSTIVASTRKLTADVTAQEQKTKRMGATLQKQTEQQLREGKKSSLIIYGVPETHEDATTQMKSDFSTLKHLYLNRVNISTDDISYIGRLGLKKENQTRPIKITCTTIEKRTKILINNQGLTIDDDEVAQCNCSEPGKHMHVYVTTDKTKQERAEEANLRQQLKDRREAGEEDIIIRRGKIVRKSETVQPRWTDVARDV